MLSSPENPRTRDCEADSLAENEGHAIWLGLASLLSGIGSIVIVALYFATYAKGDSRVTWPVLMAGVFVLPVAGIVMAINSLRTVATFRLRSSVASLGRMGLIINFLWALVIASAVVRAWFY